MEAHAFDRCRWRCVMIAICFSSTRTASGYERCIEHRQGDSNRRVLHSGADDNCNCCRGGAGCSMPWPVWEGQ